MILTLRTESPVAEIGLFKVDGTKHSYLSWQADRQLAKDMLGKIEEQLNGNDVLYTAITGIIVFSGPGSFTGLRIGITVANTLAYSLDVPIVGCKGENWVSSGLARLARHESDKLVLPNYGAEANITKPKR